MENTSETGVSNTQLLGCAGIKFLSTLQVFIFPAVLFVLDQQSRHGEIPCTLVELGINKASASNKSHFGMSKPPTMPLQLLYVMNDPANYI